MLNASTGTLRVRLDGGILYVQIYRPEADNKMNARMVHELVDVLKTNAGTAKVVVLEGLPEVFCSGADFDEIHAGTRAAGALDEKDPEPLYALYYQLARGPFVTIAHVRGKVNAGGIGLVAACDLVLSDSAATYGLSELLFGLMPACVLPFLVRRVGFSKANYMTLTTQPIPASRAQEWGLVDDCAADSADLLRKHLLRLRRLEADSIARYKRYTDQLESLIDTAKPAALAANREMFSNSATLQKIARYVEQGRFPWEAG